MTQKNILISIEERHVKNIVGGRKKVELRRRRMNLSPGDTLWIYSKAPGRQLVAKIKVKKVEGDSPSALWERHKKHCGITREAFRAYFKGVKIGFAILLGKLTRLVKPVSLDQLREKEEGFHPPQFGKYLTRDGNLLPFLLRRVPAGARV